MRTLRSQDDEFLNQCLDSTERATAIGRAESHRRWCLVAGAAMILLIAAVRVTAGMWDPITWIG